MDKLQDIIEKFKGIKETLSKGQNESDDMDPNMAKDDGKGVHVSNNPSAPGRSTMGIMNAVGAIKEAKTEAKRNLKEMKSLPKPKLVKDEGEMEMSEKVMPEVKEVHMHKDSVDGKPYDREVMKWDANGQWNLHKAEVVHCKCDEKEGDNAKCPKHPPAPAKP